MTIVIIAGGAGTRLWPLSTASRPKQFLAPIPGAESLIQQTYNRVRGLSDEILVVAPEAQADLIRQHLPELDSDSLVLEPSPHGVANAICLSLRRLSRDYSPTRPLLFLWTDHWIGDPGRFRQSLTQAASGIEAGLKLIRFGLRPSFAATNFGYIRLGPADPEFDWLRRIEAFVEKPDQETAESFIASGQYLWNMGYFMTTVDNLTTEIATVSPAIHQALERLRACSDGNLESVYSQLPSISFEQEFSERTVGAHVMACDFPWADIGSFRDLLKVLPVDSRGNAIQGPVDSQLVSGSYINNQTDIPLAVVGLENLAVVVSDNGILVADPNRVAEIGQLAKLIQNYKHPRPGQS